MASLRLTAAIISLLFLGTLAQAAPPNVNAVPRDFGHLFDLPSGCTDSNDNGWAAMGLAGRPDWVNVCAEHRLRLTPSLPNIRALADQDQKLYLGGAGPGVAVGLILDDGLFYSQGFGWRDAAKSLVPDEMTVFQAGSISKLMTGATLSALIDDPANGMSLQDPVNKYLGVRRPELETNRQVCQPIPLLMPPPPARCHLPYLSNDILLANLVSHTSGLPSDLDPSKSYANEYDWLADMQRASTMFAPGQFDAYANAGEDLVGIVIARRSGLPYPQAVRTLLFQPLGMTHSSMVPVSAGPNVAQLWSYQVRTNSTGDRAPIVTFAPVPMGAVDAVLFPGGGLATNIVDLSRFAQMWMNGYAPRRAGRPILQDATIAAAGKTLFRASGAAVPTICQADHTDPATQFGYRACGQADGFSVAWSVTKDHAGTPLFIQHNGNFNQISGGDLRISLDPSHNIAAAALISTQVHPATPAGLALPGLQKGFIENEAEADVLGTALTADDAKSWSTEPLSRGIARLLWLSGESLSNAQLQAHPLWLLNQFSPNFIANHGLTAHRHMTIIDRKRPVDGYVRAGMFPDVHNCSTFRVRGVDGPRTVHLRLSCLRRDAGLSRMFDVSLTVDDQGLIDELSDIGSTSEAF
jgi:CubicO group peptidase (beta-lactamase class C family)